MNTGLETQNSEPAVDRESQRLCPSLVTHLNAICRA